ncbi:MAG TPA: hypothetical protein VFL62_05850 [Bradyrhizobium sp.]|uniref:hypothetical protein n=1 Tax=Bradyrhizobium sp. TaxID=376 RepID=UPI002D7E7CE2|nr:hypothetical protein [Bradyrhizobium sp.]HET7885733.1 hypothetical protein [Bradyrhizobium sp.]
MSDGRLRVIRDLGPVKGGKGLKHHEVVLELTWWGMFRFAASVIRTERPTDEAQQESEAQMQTTLSSM